MSDRYTLKDANRLLKLVQVIAGEMVERRTERRGLARERSRLEAVDTPETLKRALAELDARIWEHDEALYNCRHELEDLGLKVLRTNPLTVHIPGRSLEKGDDDPDGLVFCWQEGEAAVCFGHHVGEEEDQRRPLRVAEGA